MHISVVSKIPILLFFMHHASLPCRFAALALLLYMAFLSLRGNIFSYSYMLHSLYFIHPHLFRQSLQPVVFHCIHHVTYICNFLFPPHYITFLPTLLPFLYFCNFFCKQHFLKIPCHTLYSNTFYVDLLTTFFTKLSWQ